MNDHIILGLVQNAALLLALVVIFDTIGPHFHPGRFSLQHVITGLLIGVIGMSVMLTPWVLIPGIIFDTRSVLLSISGLFFGPIPTIIAMLMTLGLRIFQGGGGTIMGVSVIIATGTIGIIWGFLRKPPLREISWKELYLFGIINHIVMLIMAFTLPINTALEVLSNITIPVLLIYPAGSAVLGKLMVNRLQREKITSDLKQSEEQLRESESKFRSLFQNNLAVMWLIDPDTGQIIDANKAACDFYGWSLEEIKNKTILDINTLSEVEVKQEMQNAVEDKRNYFQFRHRLADGEVRNVEVYSGPILHGGQKLLYSIIHDITNRKRAEEALRESNEKLELLFGLLPVGISVLNQDGRIVKMNPALVRILELSPDEISQGGYDRRDFIRLDGTPIPANELASTRILRERQPIHIELGLAKKSKEIIWLDVNALSCKLSDWAAVIVTTDITERRQGEAKLKEQVDELNRWHQVTLGRENRVMELKREINELLHQMGKPPRYSSIEQDN